MKRGEGRLWLLILFECLACLFIWWGGVVITLRNQPEHRNLDMVERQRRADWLRNELEQRPWWWLMLSGLAMIAFVHWFVDKWEQRPWRAAILWTIAMLIVLVVVVALTAHFGWGMRPVKVEATATAFGLVTGRGLGKVRACLVGDGRVSRPSGCRLAAEAVGDRLSETGGDERTWNQTT